MEERDEAVRDGGAVLSWVELVSEGVEGEWVLPEVGDVEYGLGVWEIEASEVSVEACCWRAEVRNAGGGGDSCACLRMHGIALIHLF